MKCTFKVLILLIAVAAVGVAVLEAGFDARRSPTPRVVTETRTDVPPGAVEPVAKDDMVVQNVKPAEAGASAGTSETGAPESGSAGAFRSQEQVQRAAAKSASPAEAARADEARQAAESANQAERPGAVGEEERPGGEVVHDFTKVQTDESAALLGSNEQGPEVPPAENSNAPKQVYLGDEQNVEDTGDENADLKLLGDPIAWGEVLAVNGGGAADGNGVIVTPQTGPVVKLQLTAQTTGPMPGAGARISLVLPDTESEEPAFLARRALILAYDTGEDGKKGAAKVLQLAVTVEEREALKRAEGKRVVLFAAAAE